MQNNTAKEKLQQGAVVYGILSPTTDPVVCEYIGYTGFDLYMMDAEHGAITLTEATHIIRACETAGIPVWARIRSVDEKLILQFLDAGISGVMMPGIRTAEDVRRLVAAVKYPPLGNRGMGPVRAADYLMGRLSQRQYVQWANDQIVILPQIETLECLENLDEILQVEGVDGFIIGPRDLAMAMGYYDGPANEEVKHTINGIMAKVRAAGKWVGTVAGTVEQANALTENGANIILNSVQGLIQSAGKAFLNEVRKGK
ncbi:MAG: host specificity protein [Saprospiraceae bacterium]|nr:host specificity protein [Saprospiraceae bacterium]